MAWIPRIFWGMSALLVQINDRERPESDFLAVPKVSAGALTRAHSKTKKLNGYIRLEQLNTDAEEAEPVCEIRNSCQSILSDLFCSSWLCGVIGYAARTYFTADSFYEYGHYRGASVAEIARG